ncbi:hypothetical protein ACFQ8T_12535 [Isoptericola sp. NPDC056618]|uniref:hypothetical protein n=1 Tax=Isoptericola sp. NPDC056618 TaxID=3345878 RepID=UPI0036BB2C89
MNDPQPPRYAWVDAVWLSSLKPLERLVALAYGKYVGDSLAGVWVNGDTLREITGLSRDAANRALRGLEDKGWLFVLEPSRQHLATRYLLQPGGQPSASRNAGSGADRVPEGQTGDAQRDAQRSASRNAEESSVLSPDASVPSPDASVPPDVPEPRENQEGTPPPAADGAAGRSELHELLETYGLEADERKRFLAHLKADPKLGSARKVVFSLHNRGHLEARLDDWRLDEEVDELVEAKKRQQQPASPWDRGPV